MSDEFKFKCEECGKEFDPDPLTMLECHISSEIIDDDDEEHLVAGLVNEQEMETIQLTDEEAEALEKGETITAGGMCICIECQDRLEKEQS